MARRRIRFRRPGQRWLIAALAVLAVLVLLRHLAMRSGPDAGSQERRAAEAPAASGLDLAPGERTRLAAFARARLAGGTAVAVAEGGEGEERTAVVSLGRGDRTAFVAVGRGPSFAAAVAAAVDDLAGRSDEAARAAGVLKIDLVAAIGPERRFDAGGKADLDPSLEGLWLPGADLMLLPEELASRRLTAGGDLQSGRLARYLAEGPRRIAAVEGDPGATGEPYRAVRFDSFAEGGKGLPIQLYRGNDRAPIVSPETLLAAARAGGDYLVLHQRADGTFDYLYDPTADAVEPGYNLLRHAGTCYALFELHRATLHEATGDDRFLEAGRRGIAALLAHVEGPRPEHAGAGADFDAIAEIDDDEAKLGGAALAVLAMVEHQRVSGDDRWLAGAARLARFLVHQQGPDGRFESKYFYGEPDDEHFESIYYPGEAILALARLHRLDGDPDWLAAARRGADYLIDGRDAGKATADLPHDHWLLMGLAELDELTGDPRYAAHGARIAEAIVAAQRTGSRHPDWIGSFYDPPRTTPTATRAEALVAMELLARRSGRDRRPIVEALLRMAAFQRRCQLTAVNALYLPRPDRAFGGFRRSLTDWEVRIDYVQHSVSSLLGLREILQRETAGTPSRVPGAPASQ
jgi:hypothetical protein